MKLWLALHFSLISIFSFLSLPKNCTDLKFGVYLSHMCPFNFNSKPIDFHLQNMSMMIYCVFHVLPSFWVSILFVKFICADCFPTLCSILSYRWTLIIFTLLFLQVVLLCTIWLCFLECMWKASLGMYIQREDWNCLIIGQTRPFYHMVLLNFYVELLYPSYSWVGMLEIPRTLYTSKFLFCQT